MVVVATAPELKIRQPKPILETSSCRRPPAAAVRAGLPRARSAAIMNLLRQSCSTITSSLAPSLTTSMAGNGFSGNMNILQVFSNFGAEQMPWAWATGARAGIVATPRFLVYLDGGYTQANFSRVDILFGANGTPQGFFTPSNTYNGWFLGSGFEYSFDWLPISGLFLKTEYRFSTFNTANLPIIATNGAVSADAVRSSIFTQLISTELVWRLNWSGR